MNSMRCGVVAGLLLGALWLGLPQTASAQNQTKEFRELQYKLLYNNRPSGKADVMMTWLQSDTLKVFATIEMRAPVPMFLEESSVWDPSLRPVRYTVRSKGRRAATVDAVFESGKAKLAFTQGGQRNQKELELGENAILLDNNMLSHLMLLEMRYDRAKGGVQEFKAAVPLAVSVVPIRLEFKGMKKIDVNGKKVRSEYFYGRIGSVGFELWSDPETKNLLRMRVRDQKFEALLTSES